MQPALRSGALSLALCSMFGGCKLGENASRPEAPVSAEKEAPIRTEQRRYGCTLPRDAGTISLGCTFSGAAQDLFTGYSIDSIRFAPNRSGVYRLEVYNLIPANSYRHRTTRETAAVINGQRVVLSREEVLFAAKPVSERAPVARVEGGCREEQVGSPEGALESVLTYREGVPPSHRNSLWVEIFRLEDPSAPEELVGVLSIGSQSCDLVGWTPSFNPEDPTSVGTAGNRVASVREHFELLDK